MGIRRGSISTPIIVDGLVFNMDAANRASYPRTGTTVTDTINNLSVILTNGPGFQTLGNGSINFDGVNDIGLINHNSALTSNTNTMSVSMWVNVGSIGSKFTLFLTNRNSLDNRTTFTMGIDNRQVVRTWNPSGNDTMVAWVGVGNGTTFYHAHEKELFGTTNGDNQWHNIIGTFNSNANELKLYYDGNLYYTTTTSGTLYNSGTPSWRIGSGYSGNTNYTYDLVGNIGNIQMYHKTLSAAEVLHNYNALKSRFGL